MRHHLLRSTVWRMRRAAKVDANQAEIVRGLRALGCTVQSLATVGKGCPDILVGFRGTNYCMEIKDGSKPPSAQKLTPAEVDWHDAWLGQAAVVRSLDEAVSVVFRQTPAPPPE